MPSLDTFINKAPVSVLATGSTDLITPTEQQANRNMVGVCIQPSVDIYLVDGTANGTVANSPFLISAGVPYVVNHVAGPLKAVSVTGTATVKVAIMLGHT